MSGVVDKIVDKYKARRTDDTSPPAWDEFTVNGVFENILDVVEENDTEICKEITNYVEAIRSSKDNMTEDIANKNSRLWYDLLLRLEWVKGFDEDETFPQTTITWNNETGLTWKDWFSLVCFLRRSKGEMIKNSKTKTIEELLSEQGRNVPYSLERAQITIADFYSRRVIGRLREFENSPLKKLDSIQWIHVQVFLQRLFKADAIGSLGTYITNYYHAALQVSAGIYDVLDSSPFVTKDKQFVDFMMQKDRALYLRLPLESKTQKNTNEASNDFIVLERASKENDDEESIIPMKFRSSETFILNLFNDAESSYRPLKLLIPEGTLSLKNGDALFDKILQRIELFDFTDLYLYQAPVSWDKWVNDHQEKIDNLTFDEKQALLIRNPNIITFFTTENWFPIETENNIVDFLEGLVIATGNKENKNNFATLTSALIDEFYLRDVFTYKQYLQLLHAHVSIPDDDSARLQIIDEEGSISLQVLNIIETDRDAWVALLVDMVNVSGASALKTILNSYRQRDYVTEDVIREVLNTSNILEKLVNSRDGYALDRAVDFHDFISNEEFLALFERALRSGYEPFFREFIKLKETNPDLFPITVLATLYAADSSVTIDAEEATFRLLLLAIAKSPTDAGRFINGNLGIVEDQPSGNATFRLRQEDFNILDELYFHYTQKHLE